MDKDVIIFPIHAESLHFTWRTRYFFLTHDIKIASSNSFPLDYWRKLYKENEVLGQHIYNELYLYGFSFKTADFLPLYPDDVRDDEPVLFAKYNGSFELSNVKERKLRSLFKDLEAFVNSDLNGIYLSRLQEMTKLPFLINKLEALGYQCRRWDDLEVYRTSSRFLYWSKGREGIALPKYFLPLISALMKAPRPLISFYKRVGLKNYGDFLDLTIARTEFIARLIMGLKLDPYEAAYQQNALWSFVYDREESKRQLNEIGLPFSFLFFPIPEGLDEDSEKILGKWIVGNLPFASSLSLAIAYEKKQLPRTISSEEPLLNSLGIKDCSLFTSAILKKSIDAYRVSGGNYNYAVNPEFILSSTIHALKEDSSLHLVAYSGSLLHEKVTSSLRENDPEKALDYLFANQLLISFSSLKLIPGMSAYLSSGLGKYALDKELGCVGLKEVIYPLEKEKSNLLLGNIIPFADIKRFTENYGFCPLLFLKEKDPAIIYDPYPTLLLGRYRKKGDRLSMVENYDRN